MFRYGVMVQTASIRPGIADASADEVSQSITVGLNEVVQKATKALSKFEGGGWEIMSHAITRIDRHLVVSFLLRKEE